MLELQNIAVGYDGRYLIRNVSMTFQPGRIYAVIGKNGSGKSDLLRTCCGLQSRTGTVKLDGKELTKYPARELRQKLTMLSAEQKASHLTASQFMAKEIYGTVRLSEEKQKRIISALIEVKAVGLAELSMQKLSSGERQRICLAAMLAQNADVLLLDEPAANLDSECRKLLIPIFQHLKQEGKTVILATRDMDLALGCGDEIVAIDIGKRIYTGTGESLAAEGILQKIFA